MVSKNEATGGTVNGIATKKTTWDPLKDGTLCCPYSLDNSPTTSRQTVLQQHCAFWDRNNDGVINAYDTFRGFRDLGYNLFLSILSIFIIHSGFSYPSRLRTTFIPDPFFRVFLNGIDLCKHGSDSGTYDSRGYFQPSQFNVAFEKYAAKPDEGISVREVLSLLRGQRVAMDFFGWSAAIFEWYTIVLITYNPKTGLCGKDDIKASYDGSLFWKIKTYRESGRARELPGMTFRDGIECAKRGGQPV